MNLKVNASVNKIMNPKNTQPLVLNKSRKNPAAIAAIRPTDPVALFLFAK